MGVSPRSTSHDAAASPVQAIADNLRAERQRAGLTLSAVARLAGISKSTLSQLEAGSGNPSVETLWAIAVALGVPFSQLVAAPQNRLRVVRRDERQSVVADEAEYAAALLSAGSSARRDVYAVTLEPGSARRSDPHLRGSVEHVIVAAGSMRIGPVGEEVEVAAGDYVTYPGDVAHVSEALEPGTWIVLVMEHPGA